jgi:DNA-binding GntR family transcriptional regulator
MPTVTDQKTRALFARLRDDLIAGTYAPGDRLTEQSVGTRYGASRTPAREALARLEQIGLLVRVGAGLVVPRPTVEELLDLCDAHTLIEAEIARYAADRRREGDLMRLQAAAEAAAALPDDAGVVARYHANQAFHHALSAAGHNTVLADQQRQLELRLAALRATTLTEPGRWESVLPGHAAIVAAVADRDAEAAADATRRHLAEDRRLWRRLVLAGRVPGLRP